MAIPKSTQPTPAPKGPTKFEPFSWFEHTPENEYEPAHLRETLGLQYDMARGIQHVLELVHTSTVDAETDKAGAVLVDTEVLTRLAISTAHALAEVTWRQIERIQVAADRGDNVVPLA